MKTKSQFLLPLTALTLHLFSAVQANAQLKDVNALLSNTKSVAKGTTDDIVDIALILIGLAGVILACVAVFKANSQDRDGMPKLLTMALVIIGAVMFIQILRTFIG